MTETGGSSRPTVWLDRDGTLLDDPGYLRDPAGLVLLPGAAAAVASLGRAGCRVVLVTNQSGIDRALFSPQELEVIHAELARQLALEDARLEAIYYCPHLPAELLGPGETPCDCRKPQAGMIHRARRELGVSPSAPQFCVGDKRADVELGRAVGAKTVLVLTGEGEATLRSLEARNEVDELCDWVVPSLREAAEAILDRIAPPRS